MSKIIVNSILQEYPEAADYMDCEKCGADFEHLTLGGDGDWRQTIMCNRCVHVRENVPWETVMLPLIALAYDQTVAWARQTEYELDQEYKERQMRNRA